MLRPIYFRGQYLLCLRVLAVPFPFQRILSDISARIRKLLAIAYDPLIVIPLPNLALPTQFVARSSGYRRLERPHNRRERASLHVLLTTFAGAHPLWGRSMLRPSLASNLDDPVHVVRHDHKGVQIDMGKVRWNRNPTRVHNLPKSGQFNFGRSDAAKNTSLHLCANRDEIQSWSGIIAALQPNRLMPRVKPITIAHVIHLGVWGAACCAPTKTTVYFSLAPISTSSSGKPARTGRPSGPTEAAMIMPLDSTPRNLRGARLTTTATLRPISFSGS